MSKSSRIKFQQTLAEYYSKFGRRQIEADYRLVEIGSFKQTEVQDAAAI